MTVQREHVVPRPRPPWAEPRLDVMPVLPEDPATRTRRRRSSSGRLRQRRTRLRRVLLLGYVVVAVCGLQLLWAVLNMRAAEQSLTRAHAAVATGDLAEIERHVDEAHRAAERAGWGTAGPHLAALELAPVLGDDVEALREMVGVTRSLAGPLAGDLLGLRQTLDPEAIRPVGGQVDLERIAAGGAEAVAVLPRLQRLDETLAALDPDELVGPLAAKVSAAQTRMGELRRIVEYGAGILDMGPALLGAEGRRTYLVVFQNNAELRSTGGIPTAFAVLEADDGRLTMRSEGTSPDLGYLEPGETVLPLTAEEQALFGDKLGTFLGNATMTPDFPRAAQLIREFWRVGAGEDLDGVLAVDPVALSRVLRGVGPVPLADGKVARADSVVPLLLHRTYLDYPDQPTQNAFFTDTTRRVFGALVSGRGNAGLALEGLVGAVREGRGYVWLADPAEQERIAGGVVAGQLEHASGRPVVGVFLNDSTATKLDYFVRSETSVDRVTCHDNGSQTLRVTTSITSTVPAGYAAAWPPLLVGGRFTDRPGDLLLTVSAYAPAGSRVVATSLDGRTGAPSELTYEGRPVIGRTLLLAPGQTRTLTWTIATHPGSGQAPMLRTTPSASGPGVGHVVASACP